MQLKLYYITCLYCDNICVTLEIIQNMCIVTSIVTQISSIQQGVCSDTHIITSIYTVGCLQLHRYHLYTVYSRVSVGTQISSLVSVQQGVCSDTHHHQYLYSRMSVVTHIITNIYTVGCIDTRYIDSYILIFIYLYYLFKCSCMEVLVHQMLIVLVIN